MDLKKFAEGFDAPSQELDKLAKEAEKRDRDREEKSKFGDLRTFKIPTGRTEFIFLPPYSSFYDDVQYEGMITYSTFTHWNLGSGKDKAFCPHRSHPDKDWGCPICYVIDVMLRAGADQDELQGWGSPEASEATYFQGLIVDCSSLDIPEYLPHVIRISPSIKDKVIAAFNRWGSKLYNPEKAFVYSITKEEKSGRGGSWINYDLEAVPEPMPMAQDEEQMQEILDSVYNLENLGFFTGEWTETEYRTSASLANALLRSKGFEEVETWKHVEDDDWRIDEEEAEEKGLPLLPEELVGTGKKNKKEGKRTPPKRTPPKRKTKKESEEDEEQEGD